MADEKKPGLKDKVKSLLSVSLAAKVAGAVGVSLVLLATLAWLLYALDPTRIAWGDYMTIERAILLLTLWAAACATTYVTVRVWMSDVKIGDSRVRDGWNAGINLLAKHGVNLSERPCFLVLGCPTRHQQDRWVGSDGYGTPSPTVDATPSIDWHLADDRILIFCRDLGVYGGLLSNRDTVEMAAETRGSTVAAATSISEPLTETPEAEAVADGQSLDADSDPTSNPDPATDPLDEPELEVAPNSTLDDDTSTMDSGGGATSSAPAQEAAEGASVATAKPLVKTSALPSASSTNDAMKSLDRVDELVRDAQRVEPTALKNQAQPASLSSIETAGYQETLSQLCARLRGSRFPHSGINGTLVMIDSQHLADEHSSRQVGRAICSDLNQIRSELGVWSPVTMMVAETDRQRDHDELFRRLSLAEQDKATPLGQPFDPEQIATVESLNELADDAIGQVENRINRVFQVPRALAKPQNHRLVRVLIRCRRWRSPLRALLVESCASETAETSMEGRESPIVGGLFVGAASDSPITQSFVKSIFGRMVGQQNHLAWTDHQQRRAAGHRRAVRLLISATLLLSVALLAQFVIVFQR